MEAELTAQESTPDPKVLIVEDNLEHANLMRHGLQFHDLKFDVEIVASIAAAQEAIKKKVPDIIISELKFADGKVNELVPEEPETAEFPVVILTDQGSEKEAVELLKMGALDYIVKTRRKCQEIGDLVKNSLKSWNRIRNIRKAEINLQQTLRLARSIMDSLPNPVGVLDENGQILSVNNAWKASNDLSTLFGEMVNVETQYTVYCRNLDQAYGQQIAEEIQRVIDTQIASEPIHFPTGNLETTWYSVSVHPCQGSGRARAIVIYQDITDRKRLEVNQSEKEIAEQQLEKLTPREKQVMDLVVEGKPNKSIARSLNISVKTVEMHRSNMMKKLKLRNVTDLVKLAVNAGFQRADRELLGTFSD